MSQSSMGELLSQALDLPENERLELATKLFESVEGAQEPAWDKAWLNELDRRMELVEKGEVELQDGDSVVAELLAELRAR